MDDDNCSAAMVTDLLLKEGSDLEATTMAAAVAAGAAAAAAGIAAANDGIVPHSVSRDESCGVVTAASGSVAINSNTKLQG